MNKKILLSLLLFFLTSPIFANSAVAFIYHRFAEAKYPSTNITLEQFKYQLNYFESNNYNVWPLSKIINYLNNNKTLPLKTVAITIDDAYLSVYTNAYLLLKNKNFSYTIFVNTNSIDYKSKNYMSWKMMREMQNNGAEFANHSLSHEYLLPKKDETNEAWEKRFRKEVQKAQQRLQEELGSDTNKNPKLFSYPFGEYNLKMAQILNELGYIGISQTSGAIGKDSDMQAIPRFPMAEAYATHSGFKTKLNTLPMPIESVSQKEPVIKEGTSPKLRLKLKKPLKNLRCFISSGEVIGLKWLSKTEVEISANKPIKPPRDKYTCTAPAGNSKWYWYSHLWIVR
ncbi:MAG: polysaccharide deacetylase family protein [Sulfurimonas sp.]|nr:polysaccharide deacetylase family protein [Sulfurimonas sp.]